jgi:hypothetical protein
MPLPGGHPRVQNEKKGGLKGKENKEKDRKRKKCE